jgi:hypothetical protein
VITVEGHDLNSRILSQATTPLPAELDKHTQVIY